MKYKLKDICTKITDGSHNPPQGISDSPYLMLSSKNIADDSITYDNPRYLTEADFLLENKRTSIQEGDLLLTIVGTIGRVAVVSNIEKKLCLQRSVAVLKPKQDIVKSRYLMYYLQNMRPVLEAEAKGVAQKGIYLKQVESIEVSVPSLSKQEEIVNNLDLVTQLLALQKMQLVHLDELVKSRFAELFDDGESPIKTVEELCSAIVDCPHTTPKYEGELKNPAIRTTEIKKGYIAWETMRYVSDEEYEERTARLKPEMGDIVYGREGTFGNAAILPKGYNFCLGQRVMLLRPDYSKCTSEYLLYAVISDDVYRQAVGKNNASTVAHVNVKDVKQFKIPLPSFDKQNQFAAFVEQTDKSKLAVQNSIAELEELKKSLVQKYFG